MGMSVSRLDGYTSTTTNALDVLTVCFILVLDEGLVLLSYMDGVLLVIIRYRHIMFRTWMVLLYFGRE